MPVHTNVYRTLDRGHVRRTYFHVVQHAGILCLVLLSACSSSLPVRVQKEGTTALTASIGGPIAPGKSPTVVIPYTTIGAMYGLTSYATVHGEIHALMAAFGVAGIDAGCSFKIIAQDHLLPELTGDASLYGFTGFSGMQPPTGFGDVALTASWEIGAKGLMYIGSHATLASTRSNDFKPMFSPFIGYMVNIGGSMSLNIQFIDQAANYQTNYGVLEGASSPGKYGSLGMFIGVNYALGGDGNAE